MELKGVSKLHKVPSKKIQHSHNNHKIRVSCESQFHLLRSLIVTKETMDRTKVQRSHLSNIMGRSIAYIKRAMSTPPITVASFMLRRINVYLCNNNKKGLV